jgi:DNA polymerase-4
MDAFFASVEQLDNPAWTRKPVIVGGLPSDRRSVVSTCSYEARTFGVHSAMPIVQAAKLCPQGIFVRGRISRYAQKSSEVMAIFADFSPDVQQLSIDEAFIDITGTERLFGPPQEVARKLKARVHSDAGLTVSCGIAGNKYVAKIASGMSKPDGLFVVPPGGEEAFMMGLPVEKIWGAGGKTQALFRKHGLRTCADVHDLPLENLTLAFGKSFGFFLYKAVRGQAAQDFDREPDSRSISNERTFAFDLFDTGAVESVLLEMCQGLMWRLIEGKQRARTVFVKIRYGDFSTEGAQETSDEAVATIDDMYRRVCGLFRKKYRGGRGIRLIGAGLSGLEDVSVPAQGALFTDTRTEKEAVLEQAIFQINKKHPNAVKRPAAPAGN